MQIGDIISRPDCPTVLWRIESIQTVTGPNNTIHPWISVYPCKKNGERDFRRNRIGWSGIPKGYVVVEKEGEL